MNNKKQDKKPLFAEVNLAGDEFRQYQAAKEKNLYKLLPEFWEGNN